MLNVGSAVFLADTRISLRHYRDIKIYGNGFEAELFKTAKMHKNLRRGQNMEQTNIILNIFSQKDWERGRSECLSAQTTNGTGMQEKLFTYLYSHQMTQL